MVEETNIVNEAAQAAEVSGGLGVLGINLKIFIAQLINFIIVLLVLWKWVYGPVVKLLDARSEKIEKSVKQAEDIEKRLEALDQEQKKVITKAKAEATKIMEKTRAEAEERKQEMIDKTKEEVKSVITQGKMQLQSEKEAMIRDAKGEMVSIIIEGAKKVLSENVDKDKSKKLAEDVVNKMI